MATKSNSIIKIVIFGFLSVLTAWFLFHAWQTMAQVFYPPAASLSSGDITTTHIASGTIVRADVSDSANLNPASIGTSTAFDWLRDANQTLTGDKTFATSVILQMGIASTSQPINTNRIGTSSNAYFLNNENQTIAGVKTFSSLPVTTAGDCVSDNDLCNKSYVDASGGRTTFIATAANDILGGDVVAVATTTNAGGDYATNATATDQDFGDNVGNWNAVGQSFMASSTWVLASTTARLKKAGTITDNLIMKLHSNTNSTPSGYVLASSTIDGSTIAATYANYSFVFTRSYPMIAGNTYWITIERSGAQDAINRYTIDTSLTNTFGEGQSTRLTTTQWTTTSGRDLNLTLGTQAMDEGRIYSSNGALSLAASTTVGVARLAAARGANVTVIANGTKSGYTGLTTGLLAYSNDGRQNASTTKPATGVTIGRVISSSTVLVQPWLGYPTPITY